MKRGFDDMTIKLKALVVGPLVEELFSAASISSTVKCNGNGPAQNTVLKCFRGQNIFCFN